jgi:hypothetical protein
MLALSGRIRRVGRIIRASYDAGMIAIAVEVGHNTHS